MKQKGFTLVELLVAMGLMAALAAIAIPNMLRYYKDYKFNDYAAQMDYLVKYAKIYAMERTKNVGICVNSTDKILTIRDIGISRGAGKCSGVEIKRMEVDNNDKGYIELAGDGAFGLGPTIDPRGLAIYNGSVCITNGTKYSRVYIGKASIRTESGDGGCS